MNRYKNARDTFYELIEEHGYESPGPLLNELLQFLACDQIEEFTEHLQHMGYLSMPDEESSEEESEELFPGTNEQLKGLTIRPEEK